MSDYKLIMHGHYVSGRPWSTGLYLTSSATPSAMLTSWATAVTDFWTNGSHGIQTLYHTDTILDNVEVITLTGDMKYRTRTGPTSLALAGTSSDTGGADIVSVVLSLRTSNLGAGERGRMKLPSPVEGAITNGELASTPQARFGTAGEALRTALTADGSTWFLFNRQETISKPTPFTKSIVVKAECSNILGTVRRRVKHANRTYA
jgi:hypothetical protein